MLKSTPVDFPGQPLLCIPFIPGLRDIPRWIPVHRLIWRDWNKQAASGPASQPEPEPAGQK
jgi:hypothetical protein